MSDRFTRIAVISSHLDNTEGKLLIDTGEIMRRFSKKSSINNTVHSLLLYLHYNEMESSQLQQCAGSR